MLAEVLRRVGDLDSAGREFALAMAVPLERPGGLGTLAQLRLAQGRAEEALAAAGNAVSWCEAMGGCGMFRGAFVRLAHAEALHAPGDADGARRAIEDARVRLLATAAWIPDPAYRQGFSKVSPSMPGPSRGRARGSAIRPSW